MIEMKMNGELAGEILRIAPSLRVFRNELPADVPTIAATGELAPLLAEGRPPLNLATEEAASAGAAPCTACRKRAIFLGAVAVAAMVWIVWRIRK